MFNSPPCPSPTRGEGTGGEALLDTTSSSIAARKSSFEVAKKFESTVFVRAES
jgi:hypothetical protein